MDKIAFVGDSFCSCVEETSMRETQGIISDNGKPRDSHQPLISWPQMVADEYNLEIVTWGLGGAPLYHSYDFLLHVLNTDDDRPALIADDVRYVIFCITDPDRIVNYYRLPNFAVGPANSFRNQIRINQSNYTYIKKKYNNNTEPTDADILNWSDAEKRTISETIANYNRYFSDPGYNRFVQRGNLMQIDQHMLREKRKCIWFPCFDSSMQGFVPESGPLGTIPLNNISQAEYNTYEEYLNGIGNDKRLNHFNEENNRKMFNLINYVLDKADTGTSVYDDFTPSRPGKFIVKMEDYFDVSESQRRWNHS